MSKKGFITVILTLALMLCMTTTAFADELTIVKPEKVSNLNVHKREYKSFEIIWNKVEGATGYEVYRSTTGKAGSFALKKTTKGTSYINSDIKMKKKYYYKVRAINELGKGAFSDVKSNYSLPVRAENLIVAAREKMQFHFIGISHPVH